MVTTAVKQVKEQSSAALRFLVLIRSYLMHLRDNCASTNHETQFYLDWDILFEAINADQAQCVYGGILWRTFGTFSQPDSTRERFFLPDGTVEEMLYFLQDVVIATQASRRQVERARGAEQSITASPIRHWSDAWKAVLHKIRLHLNVKAVSRLSYILDHFCEPAPITVTELPEVAQQYYMKRLGEVRSKRDQTRRNTADSRNLSAVEELQRRDGSRVHKLVTTTGAVRRASDLLTADPIYLYLDAHMRARFEGLDERQHELDLCIRDISSLIPDLDQLLIFEAEARTETQRVELIESVLASIKAVEGNARLVDLLRSMSVVTQDIRNRLTSIPRSAHAADENTMQATTFDQSIVTLRRQITRLLNQALGSADLPELFDLDTEIVRVCDTISRLTIRQRRREQVIARAECHADGAVSINWDTYESVHVFSKTVTAALRAEGISGVRIACRMPNEVGARFCEAGIENMTDAITALGNDTMPRLVNITTARDRFWYHFVEEPGQAVGSVERLNRVAVAIAPHGTLRSFEALFDETAAQWVTPAPVVYAIKRYRDAISEGR
jgi:hypothetical protein